MFRPEEIISQHITLEEIIQALIEDDPDARLENETQGQRTFTEEQILARMTLHECHFSELRPVTLWHPVADLSITTYDTRDEFICIAIGVKLNAGTAGYPLGEVLDFLKNRTIRWMRKDVARQLAKYGCKVPKSIYKQHEAPQTTPPVMHAPVHGTPCGERTADAAQDEIPEPVARQHAQDVAILSALGRLGYDPLNLPRNEPGKPGVKDAVKKFLGTRGMWAGSTVFTKAWKRLRAAEQIKDKE